MARTNRHTRLLIPQEAVKFIGSRRAVFPTVQCTYCKRHRDYTSMYRISIWDTSGQVCYRCLGSARTQRANELWGLRVPNPHTYRRRRSALHGLVSAAQERRRAEVRRKRKRAEYLRYKERLANGAVHHVRRDMQIEYEAPRRRSVKGTERALIVEQFDQTCVYCRRRSESVTKDPDGKTWHVDHVAPLSRGGTYALSNLALSCARCNHTKSAAEGIKVPTPIGLNRRALNTRRGY